MKISTLEEEINALKQKKDKIEPTDQLEESQKYITQKEEELRQLEIELMHAQDHIKILEESA